MIYCRRMGDCEDSSPQGPVAPLFNEGRYFEAHEELGDGLGKRNGARSAGCIRVSWRPASRTCIFAAATMQAH